MSQLDTCSQNLAFSLLYFLIAALNLVLSISAQAGPLTCLFRLASNKFSFVSDCSGGFLSSFDTSKHIPTQSASLQTTLARGWTVSWLAHCFQLSTLCPHSSTSKSNQQDRSLNTSPFTPHSQQSGHTGPSFLQVDKHSPASGYLHILFLQSRILLPCSSLCYPLPLTVLA